MKVTFGDKAENTIVFLRFILKWWLVVNTKGSFEEVYAKDWRRSPIKSSDDWQFSFHNEEVNHFASFLCKGEGKREKKLTIDTSDALKYTSMALSLYPQEMLKSH